jgi:hypothetical protein
MLPRPACALALCLVSVCARAEEPPPPGDLEQRVRKLEEDNVRLRKLVEDGAAQLAELRENQETTNAQVKRLLPWAGLITGYLDFGFFYVQGDGSGIRPDIGYAHFPEYKGVVPDSWVFMGDPLSTAINSRGDPADTGPSRAVVFNPIQSGGKATFIVNNISIALFGALSENLQFNGLIDFLPRGRDVSNPNGLFLGDYIDVKLGYVEYNLPIERLHLAISAGKFDSVLGYEYRIQEAPDRITVTPSLICRYICGRPVGLKARFRFFDDRLAFNFAVTNGSHFINQFPFHNEIDSNFFKTIAGRLSYKFPVGAGLELGVSGAFGAQDNQSDDGVHQWHYGFDAHFEKRGFDVTAEFVQGRAEGKSDPGGVPCGVAPCLKYMGAYGLIAYRFSNWLMPYVRVDWRDAWHESGASFVYITQIVRLAGGARLELSPNVIVKAEYVYDHKLGRLADFPSDIFTSSLVIKF